MSVGNGDDAFSCANRILIEAHLKEVLILRREIDELRKQLNAHQARAVVPNGSVVPHGNHKKQAVKATPSTPRSGWQIPFTPPSKIVHSPRGLLSLPKYYENGYEGRGKACTSALHAFRDLEEELCALSNTHSDEPLSPQGTSQSESSRSRTLYSRVDVATPRSTGSKMSDSLYQLRGVWCMTDVHLRQLEVTKFKSSQTSSSFSLPKDTSIKQVKRGDIVAIARTWSILDVKFKCVHPESSPRIAWDTCSMLFLFYDSVMIPLEFFNFGIVAFTNIMNTILCIFWCLDIFASFLTGAYINGELCQSFPLIARHYVRTWFFVDMSLVVLEMVLILQDLSSDQVEVSSLSGLRIIRMFRFLRLLRLVKLSLFASKLMRRVNNANVLLLFKMLKHLMLLIMLNHVVAALWYVTGQSEDESDGWFNEGSFGSRSPMYCYLSSLHWTFTQFHGSMEIFPTNERERALACSMLLLGLVAYSSFLGSMTNSITTFHSFHAERTRNYGLLCNYLAIHNISGPLCAKAKNYFEDQMLSSHMQQNLDLHSFLPTHIIMDLHEESRVQHVLSNGLLFSIHCHYPRIVRKLCYAAMSELEAKWGHDFFFLGDTCTRVLILTSGTLNYVWRGDHQCTRHSHPDAQTIHDNRWICELVLWTQWVCHGWLASTTDCRVLTIEEASFAKVICEHQSAFVTAADYARLVIASFVSKSPSDLFDGSAIIAEEGRGPPRKTLMEWLWNN